MPNQAFEQLDPVQQRVLQALAIFNRAVPPPAVCSVLQPYEPELTPKQAQSILKTLRDVLPDVVAQANDQFYVLASALPIILATIPRGDPTDAYEAGTPQFSQFALLYRAADYYHSLRKPKRQWVALRDLQPQLDEFDLRCSAEDYTTAAYLLAEISFDYLLRWGQHQLITSLREQLVDHLDDPNLAQANLGELGSAWAYLGDQAKAILYQEKALIIARQNNDSTNEAVWLMNLGNRYLALGQVNTAEGYYIQALGLNQTLQDHRAEGVCLAALGTCYALLGKMDFALDYYAQAQAIAKEIGDLNAEGYSLTNLGNVYTSLGNYAHAISAHDQSLAIARQLGQRVEEGRRLGNLAEALIADRQFTEALEHLQLGLQIDDETGYARGKNFKGNALACAYLMMGNLPEARRAVENAVKFDTPQNNHNVYALLGLIALRQGSAADKAAAQIAFKTALHHADQQLAHTPNAHDPLNAKGLALSGLALLAKDPADQTARLTEAESAYRASRAENRSPGLVLSSFRLFEALVTVDNGAVLDSRNSLRAAVREGLSDER